MPIGANDETREVEPTDETRVVGRASNHETRDAQPALTASQPAPKRIAELGGHRLGGELGRGGMGVVYRAEHLATGAQRAMKVLLADPGAPEAERFRREGQAMAAVGGHPNVLRVHAAGEAPGALWLAMDLAEGGSLEERVERLGPRPSDEVARLGAALARGLAHVHGHGVLHRDLKPGNVLFDGRDRPMLVDFGLARVGGAERLTETGVIVGTPRYMSPEQCLADKGLPVDARTDVYGLGAVLYHALTGAAPVEGESMLEVLRRVVAEPPVPPGRLAANVSPALEAVILRCLEKGPQRRYATAAALADDLEAVVAGRSPPGLPRPRRDPVTLLLAAASVVVAVALVLQLQRHRAPPAPPLPPPIVASPPPRTAEEALAALDDLLAREEEAAALATLEAILERSRADPLSAPRLQELAPRLFAALLGARSGPQADDDVVVARWSARGPALAAAARTARAFDDERAPRSAFSSVPGAAAVAGALAEVRVGLRALRDLLTSERSAELLPSLERAVALAEETAPGAAGAALRLRVQRALIGADVALLRAGRQRPAPVLALLDRGRRLRAGSRAADALQVTACLVEWRDPTGQGRVRLPDGADVARLGRYPPQQLVLDGLRLLGADRDAAGIAAGLAAWERLRDTARRLGLLDARGEFGPDVLVPIELSPHADLMLRAHEERGTLLLWSAWLARGGPDAAERLDAALASAEATRRARPAVGAEQVLRVHLLAADVSAARRTVQTFPNDAGLDDWILRCLQADLALLEGNVDGARRSLAALLEQVMVAATLRTEIARSEQVRGVFVRGQVELWAAAVEAEAGAFEGAEALLVRARANLAGQPSQELLVPWRTVAATALAIERARGGWRVAATGRLYPE